jgi:predicted ATPase
MVYVITGGPGFGKTTIINLLAKWNYPVCEEGARGLLQTHSEANMQDGTDHIPPDFEKRVAFERLRFLNEAGINSIAFSDRGLPDQIAYSWYKKKQPSSFIEEVVLANRYAPHVFVTPPWEEIYTQDGIRRENFEEALLIHEQIVKAYLKYRYKLVNLPKTNPEMRAKFILNFLGI